MSALRAFETVVPRLDAEEGLREGEDYILSGARGGMGPLGIFLTCLVLGCALFGLGAWVLAGMPMPS